MRQANAGNPVKERSDHVGQPKSGGPDPECGDARHEEKSDGAHHRHEVGPPGHRGFSNMSTRPATTRNASSAASDTLAFIRPSVSRN